MEPHQRTEPPPQDPQLLNLLVAGKKALDTASYQLADHQLRQALALLPGNCWQDSPELAQQLCLAAARATYLAGNLSLCRQLCQTIHQHCASPAAALQASAIETAALYAHQDPGQALIVGEQALARHGITLSAPYWWRFLPYRWWQFFFLLSSLALRRPANLFALTKESRPERIPLDELLMVLSLAAESAAPQKVPGLWRQLARNSLDQGYTEKTLQQGVPAAARLAASSSPYLLRQARKQLAFCCRMLRMQASRQQHPFSRYHQTVLADQRPQQLPPGGGAASPEMTPPSLMPEFSGMTAAVTALLSFLAGEPLAKLTSNVLRSRQSCLQHGQQPPLVYHDLVLQMISNLRRPNETPECLRGRYLHEESEHLQQAGDQAFLFVLYSCKSLLALFFHRYQQALDCSVMARRYAAAGRFNVLWPHFLYTDSLARLMALPTLSFADRHFQLLGISRNRQQLRQWAMAAPILYQHRHLLVEAAYHSQTGRTAEAEISFQKAINWAHREGFLPDEGLACELSAALHRRHGNTARATSLYQQAAGCYRQWGASAKLTESPGPEHQDLASETPVVVPPELHLSQQSVTTSSPLMENIQHLAELTDSAAIGRYALISCRDICGAARAVLLQRADQQWYSELSLNAGSIAPSPSGGEPFSSQHFPLSLLDFSGKIGLDVSYELSAGETLFAGDPYIIANRPDALFCLPVLHQEQLFGLIYLENSCGCGSFQPGSKEQVRLLARQAAIAQKNAALIARLENTVHSLHTEIDRRQEAHKQVLHAKKIGALNRLSASISHEFGNPLLGVKYLFDDFARRNHFSASDMELIRLGQQECERMRGLISNLQQLNRSSRAAKQQVDIHQLVENVLVFQKKYFADHNITVVRDCTTAPLCAMAVAEQISQVLFTLIMNAVEAMAGGGTLTLATDTANDGVLVTVSDTGTGIALMDQERIFEPFFTTKKEEEGSGLGLSVAYGIVQGHQGRLSFDSTPGQGTSFTLFLPSRDRPEQDQL